VIVCVTPNPAVDLTYRVSEHRVGEVNRVHEVASRPGGKGVNVGLVLRALGMEALHAVPLGGDTGRWIEQRLIDLGASTLSFPIDGETRRTVTVVPPDAHPTGYSEPGPTMTESDWTWFTDLIVDRVRERRADAVVISGSLPPGLDGRDLAGAVRRFRQEGAIVGVDTSGAGLLAAAEAGADFVKPNADELVRATGVLAWHEAAHALIDAGAKLVAVSHGSEGLNCCTAVRCIRAVTPKMVGNPTGAGDATVAGLVEALVAGRDLEEVAAAAAATGAAAVLRDTGGEIDSAALPSIFHATHTEERPCPLPR
jgi:tagatose 6-phosphate kinase